MEKYCRAGRVTDDMGYRHACWIRNTTNTLSEYLILIVFPLQQWLRERVSSCAIRTLPVYNNSLSERELE